MNQRSDLVSKRCFNGDIGDLRWLRYVRGKVVFKRERKRIDLCKEGIEL